MNYVEIVDKIAALRAQDKTRDEIVDHFPARYKSSVDSVLACCYEMPTRQGFILQNYFPEGQ